MSAISARLNNSSPSRISLDTARLFNPPTATPSTSEASQPRHPLANPFSADRFGGGPAGAGGAQELIQKLEDLVQTVGKLSQLLGAPGSQGAGSPEAGATPGVGGPTSPGGASPLEAAPAREQVPDLGDVSGPGGASDAKSFLGKGLHSKENVYEEIAHDSPGLGEKNKALWDAAHQAGASDEEASLLVAQQMQEGANDPSKSGGAENFGPMNLNRGLLKDFGGVKEENLSKLNENSGGKYTPEALRANVEGALTAMRTMGTERYLDHTRGGGSGYDRPTERLPFAGPATADDDTRRFGRNIANAANRVLADFQKDPHSISRDWRQAASIPYI